MLTVQKSDGGQAVPGQVKFALQQEARLQAVQEWNPGKVTKCQHEAKPIMHNVHCGQNGILGRKHKALVTYTLTQSSEKKESACNRHRVPAPANLSFQNHKIFIDF